MNAPDRFVQILVVNLAGISASVLGFSLFPIVHPSSRIMIPSRTQGVKHEALMRGNLSRFRPMTYISTTLF